MVQFKVVYSSQYNAPCAVITNWNTTAKTVIAYCKAVNAIYHEADGEMTYVLQLPDRPIELYTESALLRTTAFLGHGG